MHVPLGLDEAVTQGLGIALIGRCDRCRQQLIEFHLLSSPPLVEALLSALLQEGARAAQAGEFTLRAFLAGKIDLTRAEAVLGVIEANDREELSQALAQLAGGLSRPLQGLRDELMNLLADVEAELDFAEEAVAFISPEQLLVRLARALAQVTLLSKQIEGRTLRDRPFRMVLAGRVNAGKSSLFNALTGGRALVSSEPGTTRDYLIGRLMLGDIVAELVDTAGWQEPRDGIDAEAQRLGWIQGRGADLVIWCRPLDAEPETIPIMVSENAIEVITKCDVADADELSRAEGLTLTSSATSAGLTDLRAVLTEHMKARQPAALTASLARCRHHVDACLEYLRQAHRGVLEEEPREILALEIRGALEEAGAIAGTVYTEDLLERIFSRFCIGK